MAELEGRAAGDGESLGERVLAAAAAGEEPSALAAQLAVADPREGLAAAAMLGRSRQAAAAAVLAAVAEGVGGGSKELRKEARRGLHRLAGLGIAVPRPRPAAAAPPVFERPAVLAAAQATIADGVGSRAVWLRADRPLGGVYSLALVLNDVVGMKACSVDETTRRRAEEQLARWRERTNRAWIELPTEYARQLLGEALELNRESGFTVPRDWLVRQRAFAELVRPFERAVVYDEIPAAEVALDPEPLERSPELLDEEELKGWFFGFDEVRSFALDLLQARQSQIVLSEGLKAEREQRIVANAIREVVTPPIQRGLTRRLEEAAYYFLKTDRPRQARQALAAARRLAEGASTLHPLLVALVQRSLELASEVEMAKVPIELVRRSPHDPIE